MQPIKIGITGHRPHIFTNPRHARKICAATASYYRHYMHSRNHPIEFNVGGCHGADSWFTEQARIEGISYNMYLPFPSHLQTRWWTTEESQLHNQHVLQAKSVWTYSNHFSKEAFYKRDMEIVKNSYFMVAFWEGHRSGGTYNTIKYALRHGILVFNAMNDLEQIVTI